MASGLASIFPGIDLCATPSGPPPEGQASNLDNPTDLLEDLVIWLTVIPTVISIVFASGRLWANLKKLTWSDGMVPISKSLLTCTMRLLMFIRHIGLVLVSTLIAVTEIALLRICRYGFCGC